MKIYILTCINEDGDLVSVDVFKSMGGAKCAMTTSYNREKEEFLREGYVNPDHDFHEPLRACIGSDSYYYYYQITEKEFEP